MMDLLREYRSVRETVGTLTRSSSGTLAVVGPDRYSWLQGMVTNDVRILELAPAGVSLRACVLNATGHLLTDLTLLSVRGAGALASACGIAGQDFILVDLPRRNLPVVAALFDRYIIMEDVEVRDVTDRVACLSFQGPAVARQETLGRAGDLCALLSAADVERAAADHTGSGGWDIYVPPARYDEILARARSLGVPLIGPEAEELLRIEAGIPLYGIDMDETTIPLEANLGSTHVSFTKGCYVGQEIIARIDSRGHTNRSLVGFRMEAGDLFAPGDIVYPDPAVSDDEYREIGRITSVAASAPAVGGAPIALGYARHEAGVPGMRLVARGEGRRSDLRVTALPFGP